MTVTRRIIGAVLTAALTLQADLVLAAPVRSAVGAERRAMQTADPELMARFLHEVPVGSNLRVRTSTGRERVVLMAVEPDAIVVQRRGRRCASGQQGLGGRPRFGNGREKPCNTVCDLPR